MQLQQVQRWRQSKHAEIALGTAAAVAGAFLLLCLIVGVAVVCAAIVGVVT